MPKIQELRMNAHYSLESPPTIVLVKGKQLRFLRHLKAAEKTAKMDMSDFELNVLPREIGGR
jgi:hypothetical protein